MEPFSGRQNKAHGILILCLSDLGFQAENHKLSCKNNTHTYTNIFHPKTFTGILETPVVHILSHHQYQNFKTGRRNMQEENGCNTQSKHGGLYIPHSSKLLPLSFAFSSMESSVL